MGRDPQAGLGRAAERRVIAPDRGHLRPRAAPEKHLETAYRELLFWQRRTADFSRPKCI